MSGRRSEFEIGRLFEQLEVLLGQKGADAKAAVRQGDLFDAVGKVLRDQQPVSRTSDEDAGLSVSMTENGLLVRLSVLQICYTATLVLTPNTSGDRMIARWVYPAPFAEAPPMVIPMLPLGIAEYVDCPSREKFGQWVATGSADRGSVVIFGTDGDATFGADARVTRIRAFAFGLGQALPD